MANTLVGSELRAGSGFARKGEGFQLIFGETWNFRVKTDTVTSDRLDVLYNTPGLPYAGLIYGPLNLVCEEVNCERETQHALYWNVQARFQTGSEQQKSEDQQNPSPDPLSWIPVFRAESFSTRERVITKDQTGKFCLNSAWTPFSEPMVRTSPMCQIGFVQFEDATLKLKAIMDRNDCVNVATFNAAGQTFAARTLLVAVEEAELGSFAGFTAWRVKYKLTYDPLTHDEIRLDVGPKYLVAGVPTQYRDTQGFPLIASLDGNGGLAANQNQPAELTFRIKKEISFSWIRT